ncbi:helix-turn-helix transcriptional regulator [Providencia stuartii]|uniref:helix-turn-helix transcriptional regulator n=1 Tax=Providencia stuartii TaxID=588 RepID=UPI000E0252F9|nr:DNA-binding transcriptional regulator, XRE-family HTH domain [Providencia stuartii]CAK6617457.1 DNA-binding transcriptional regulator, XRE-family HTH domain [Providencia stuartii]SUC45688.1 transcriptional regulator, y4mF family [Providencia stuartii]
MYTFVMNNKEVQMNYISRYRKKLGLTQTDLAKELGCTKGNISHYENGRRKADLEVCRKLVRFFNNNGINVTIDDIFPPKAA